MSATFCPATMCPLFAAGGSVWTKDVNAPCKRGECGWFFRGRCEGSQCADENVHEAPVTAAPSSFDCSRAGECQWQAESSPNLCPPRRALAQGKDPRSCSN